MALSAKMPTNIYYRVKRVIKYVYIYIYIYRSNHKASVYSVADQEELLGELPASLKAEIISMVYQKTFETIHFFNGKDPNFLLGLMPLLRHLVLNKREIAYSEGDLPEDIYFIEKGRIKLVDEDGIPFIQYMEGSFFGEIEICKGQVSI